MAKKTPKRAPKKKEPEKRPYELGRRLDQMDQTRAAVLRAARVQLEEQGYRSLTMASLATESGVTRQTLHNLFGSKTAILEALFDNIALDGGMERMREAMTQRDPSKMLTQFVHVFCDFWAQNTVLFRRIRGIGTIDPEFHEVLSARNERRHNAATRIVSKLGASRNAAQRVASLTALTSFEFYDSLAQCGLDPEAAGSEILRLAHAALKTPNN